MGLEIGAKLQSLWELVKPDKKYRVIIQLFILKALILFPYILSNIVKPINTKQKRPIDKKIK